MLIRCWKLQRSRTQHCLNVNSTLCNVVISYQPENKVETTLKYLLGSNNIVLMLIQRCATSQYHINLKTRLQRRWNICWVVSVLLWCFRFLAFHISLSIVIWIVRRSFVTFFVTFWSLTRAFKISTQFVDVIFIALLSLLIVWRKCFHTLHLSVHSYSPGNMVSLFVLQLLRNGLSLFLLYRSSYIFWFTYKTWWSISN